MDNMARAIANDKSDPNNFPEDNGFRLCLGCGVDIKTEEDIEEFDSCYQHLSSVAGLKEECFHKVRDIKTLYQRLKERDEKVVSLNEEVAYLKKGWAIKDERIHEIESLVLDRDGHIEELQAALTKSNEQFDRMNQLVQAYEKLLKG